MVPVNQNPPPPSPHYLEKVMEHIFLGRLLEECWFKRGWIVEVMRAEVDAAGFDLILEANGVVRHVQLKATRKGGATTGVEVNRRLTLRQGPCVVWMEHKATTSDGLEVLYRWWSASELPQKQGKNLTHSRLRRSDFKQKSTEISKVADWLFLANP